MRGGSIRERASKPKDPEQKNKTVSLKDLISRFRSKRDIFDSLLCSVRSYSFTLK